MGLYQQVLQDGSVAADDTAEQIELLFSGLVVKQAGYLRPYNRIYQEVFNLDWVEKQLEKLRPYADPKCDRGQYHVNLRLISGF